MKRGEWVCTWDSRYGPCAFFHHCPEVLLSLAADFQASGREISITNDGKVLRV